MAGLIQQSMNADPLKNVTGYEAEKITVDPTKDTVAGQIKTITDVNSPLMMSARTSAKQTAAKTGLLNSSIAAGAGEKAVIQTALPIAQQDASTYFQASRDNKDAANAALQFNAGEKNQFANQQLQGEQNLKQIQAQGSVQSGLAYQQSLYDKNMQELRGQQQMDLERIASDNRLLLQNNSSAGQIMNTAMSQIGAILSNPDIPADAKQGQIDQINALLKEQLLVLGKTIDLDLGGVLNGTGPATKGSTYTPPPTTTTTQPKVAVPGTTPLASQINAIHNSAANEQQALGQMYQAIQNAGYTTTASVAQALGISEEMVRTNLAKIGASLA